MQLIKLKNKLIITITITITITIILTTTTTITTTTTTTTTTITTIIMSRYYGTCRYTQTRYRTSPCRLGSRPTGGYVTTTPSHHSVVHQNCLLKGQATGMSRGFHGRKFTKRRGIIVTHLTLGLRGRLLQYKRNGHLGLEKRSGEWAEQTRVSRANKTRWRGGFCQTKSTSTGTGYLAGTELSSQLRNPVGSFALQEKCFYCVKTKKPFLVCIGNRMGRVKLRIKITLVFRNCRN